MVTKKQRRTQLARARAQRRSERAIRREARDRMVRTLAIVAAVVIAAAALAFWIVTHDGDSAAATATTTATASGTVSVDYDALSAVMSTTPNEVSR